MYCVTVYLFFIRWWCNLNEFPPNLTSNLCPVEFDWLNLKFDWAWNTGQIGCKSIEMIPNSTRQAYNVISVNLHPFWAVFHAWSNWVSSLWIYTQFEQYFMPGQIGYHPNQWIYSQFDRAWNTAQIGLKFMDLHPIWAVFHAWSNWVSSLWIYTQFKQYFMPGRIGYHPNQWIYSQFDRAWNTAQNGCKFTEINCLPAWSNWVSFQWIYSHFEQYFMPGRIWPGMKYCSIWVEIHGFTPNLSSIPGLVKLGIIPMNLLPFWAVFHAWSNSTGHEILLKMGVNSLRLIVCLPGWIGYHSNEFNWHLSQWIYSQFNRSNSTGHEILLKMGVNSLRLHCMPVWSNWVSSQWIYTQFDQYFMPSRMSNLTGHKLLVKLGGNSLRLHHHLMKNKYKVTQYIWSRFGQQIDRFY